MLATLCSSTLPSEPQKLTFEFSMYTAVSTKVVQKNRKSVRDNAERSSGKYSINFK